MIIDNVANTLRFIRELRGTDVRMMAQDYADGVLGRYGYARRPSVGMRLLPIAGAFGAGLAVGATLGLVFAPKAGVETRQDIARRVGGAVNKVKQTVGRTNGHRVITEDEEIGQPRHT